MSRPGLLAKPGRFVIVERQVAAAFVLALILSLLMAGAALHSTRVAGQLAERMQFRLLALTHLSALLLATSDVDSAARGFIIQPDAATALLKEQARQRARAELKDLLAVAQQELPVDGLQALVSLVERRLAQLEALVEQRRSAGFDAAQAEVASRQGEQLREALRQQVAELRASLLQAMAPIEAAAERARRLAQWSTVAAFLLLLVFGGLATRRIMADLRRLRAADAALIARTAELQDRNEELATRAVALAEATERAASADRLKSAFLATMSHELRTPLNSIIGFTGILLQRLAGPLNDEQNRQLGMVRGSARQLLALINDVLDISKIEAGRFEMACVPYDLGQVLDQTVETVRPMAEAKGLTLQVELDAATRTGLQQAVGDARRVGQILLNLLSNAIKFTSSGGVTLGLSLQADELPAKRQVLITLQDTGEGIAPEHLHQLFRPFSQIDSRLARQHEGTGLGLAISQRLAGLIGGQISVASAVGKGSTFSLLMPLQCIDPEATST